MGFGSRATRPGVGIGRPRRSRFWKTGYFSRSLSSGTEVNDPVLLARVLGPYAADAHGHYDKIYLIANGGTKLSLIRTDSGTSCTVRHHAMEPGTPGSASGDSEEARQTAISIAP